MPDLVVPRCAWRKVRSDGRPIVQMCCPACGVWGSLQDHEIAADGEVMPSVVCANDGKVHTVRVVEGRGIAVEHQGDRRSPCTFHAHVRLEGW